MVRLTIEALLQEIAKPPGATEGAAAAAGLTREGGAVPEDREAYGLAAGLAIGLITLGKGRNAKGLSNLQIEEKMRCVANTKGQ